MRIETLTRWLAVMLMVALCGLPQAVAQAGQALPDSPSTIRQQENAELLAAMMPPQQPEQQPTPESEQEQEEEALPQADQQTTTPADPNSPAQVDPTQGPLQPVPTQTPEEGEEVETPQTERFPDVQPQTTRMPQQTPPTRQPEPAGTAAAERGPVAGGAASKPAGTAIAPAKQRQVRSFLIRMGAVMAGAAALGIVYGLSRSSPSTPPGADTTGTRR